MSQALVLANVPIAGTTITVAGLGQLSVRQDARGVYYLRLPTGSPSNRQLFQSLTTSNEEATVAAMPSHDIDIQIVQNQDLQQFAAKILRRDGYFRAVLIQSRGTVQALCSQKCAKPGSHKFLDCRTIAGFCGEACAECVWQSHAANCDHHT